MEHHAVKFEPRQETERGNKGEFSKCVHLFVRRALKGSRPTGVKNEERGAEGVRPFKRVAGWMLCALALWSGPARAGELADLDGFLRSAKAGQARFEQAATPPGYSSVPGRVRRSSGGFYFERPGKFRFDDEHPFKQSILGDGSTLWIYDKDLAQATSRPQAAAMAGQPAELLADPGAWRSLLRASSSQSPASTTA